MHDQLFMAVYSLLINHIMGCSVHQDILLGKVGSPSAAALDYRAFCAEQAASKALAADRDIGSGKSAAPAIIQGTTGATHSRAAPSSVKEQGAADNGAAASAKPAAADLGDKSAAERVCVRLYKAAKASQRRKAAYTKAVVEAEAAAHRAAAPHVLSASATSSRPLTPGDSLS